ncbi:CRISPR-associated ring nuclease [Methylomicrobium album]|uniref:adenosine deaminase n=1 Tax=Methylomicrobium album BG8 TaxID=686340 RepID=H8GGR4_METAL|nr:CRISPR-associated ring nuclease [Methylomicrobium album]EIC30027.1 adenosine deaminase [Methylomicrobium album BG8]
MRNILLCTLGASWAVVPEVYAFLAPGKFPLYHHHPQREKLLGLRAQYRLAEPDEIWVCTTQGTQRSLDSLKAWIACWPRSPILRVWRAESTDQLATQQECAAIRELIVRACLKAHHHSGGGQVVLSLAGGRKTMSADMQWAGSLLGCQALLHVISADGLPKEFREALPSVFTQPLPPEWAALVTPLVAGQTVRSDLLDIKVDAAEPIKTEDYPLPLPEAGQIATFADSGASLGQELSKREKASSRLFGNYLQDISRDETHENWRSLYRLPPRRIDQLRNSRLTENHRDWLTALPKADLHRHLGGCLDLNAQRHVAQAIWRNLTEPEQRQALQDCQPLLQAETWAWDWPVSLKANGTRSHRTAALLLHSSDQQLQHNLWYVTEPRIGLKQRHEKGFAAYERPGELTGSALLGYPAAIAPYAQAVVDQAVAEGLAYIELRGSPQKYGDSLTFLESFHQALNDSLTSLPTEKKPCFRFIIIADRRAKEIELADTIRQAVIAKRRLPDFIAGLDLAGDEQQTQPEAIAHLFNPAFAECLPITIHAGEGEAAESIWQATYHLHADRIGHGLTLNDNDKLAQRFRDRSICLELCPTSNREVVGFHDPRYSESRDCPPYPLMELWRKGLPLTLCTDNPGISRTSLADEYLAAAAMSGYRLSQWDVLAMIKQGFVHSFLSAQHKEKLLKRIDAQLYIQLTENP